MTALGMLTAIAEEHVLLQHQVPCEYSPDSHTCTNHVTTRVICCNPAENGNICAAAEARIKERAQTAKCFCGRPAAICWRFLPI